MSVMPSLPDAVIARGDLRSAGGDFYHSDRRVRGSGHLMRSLLGADMRALLSEGKAGIIASGLRWGEGPAYLPDRDVWIFSDIPNNRMLCFSEGEGTSVFRHPANFANGNFPLPEGGFLTCEHLSRSVTRTDRDGTVTTLSTCYQGARLNSPNDVVVARDGTIWFTDPTYGILSDVEGEKAEPEQARNRVYRLDAVTGISAEIESLSMPNGLAFSPDETVLYVADRGAEMGPELGFDPDGPRDVHAFPIGRDGHVEGEGRLFHRVRNGVPDGMRCDADGYVWIATGEGIVCCAPDGQVSGTIATPDIASNVAFGGVGGNQPLVTTETSAYLLTP